MELLGWLAAGRCYSSTGGLLLHSCGALHHRHWRAHMSAHMHRLGTGVCYALTGTGTTTSAVASAAAAAAAWAPSNLQGYAGQCCAGQCKKCSAEQCSAMHGSVMQGSAGQSSAGQNFENARTLLAALSLSLHVLPIVRCKLNTVRLRGSVMC